MQNAAVQRGYSIEVPKKDQSGEFFVFFAGNQISGDVKAHNPDWSAGGILRPKVITLRYRHGYIRKCEITGLRQQMISEAATNILPNERRHLAPTYVINDGDGPQVIGKMKDGSHDGLLRTPFYPSDEIDRLTSRVDGVVRMPCANAEEAIAAQIFLFPNWKHIVAGDATLPTRIDDLMVYFKGRLTAANTDQERAVARAAIKSCEDYKTWGQRVTTTANAMLRSMNVKGHGWTYGSDAELAFEQLNLQRQDTLVQDQGNKLDGLVDAMTTFVERTAPGERDPEYQEFLNWKTAQAEAAAAADAAKDARWVMVEGRKGRVTHPNYFGKLKVKFEDGTEEVFSRKVVVNIEEKEEELV